MSHETVSAIATSLAKSRILGERLTLVWHAGEPTAVPIAWYREAFKILAATLPTQTVVTHSFQTNATLINPEWVAFFREFNVSVGVSIDGPALLNDRHRVSRNGKGTFSAAMRGVDVLRRGGIDPHVIAVLTSDTLDHPDVVFDFFHGTRFTTIGFNIEEAECAHPESGLAAAGTEQRYRRFMSRLIELNQKNGNALHIRDVNAMTAAILGHGDPTSAPQQLTANKIISIGWDGCISAYSPELLGATSSKYNDFVFGQIDRNVPLDRLIDTPAFRTFSSDIALGVERCRTECPYFAICGGGSPGNKFFENSTVNSTETMYCRLTVKALANTVLAYLEKDAGFHSASSESETAA